jgi:hypothetical protein
MIGEHLRVESFSSPRDEGRKPIKNKEVSSMFMYMSFQPIFALIAGILILIFPRLLNYIIALYLIIIGIVGLIR